MPTPRHAQPRLRGSSARALALLAGVVALAMSATFAFPAAALRAPTPAPSPRATPAPPPWSLPSAPASVPLPALPRLPASLDAPQPYRPQRFCDPSPKPGTLALAALLERTYPMTGSDGISRACHLGGRSEHKEGRGFDWAADVRIRSEAQAAGRFLRWLTALDATGTPVMARRMGVMYIIYDRHIWSISEPRWKPYTGADPHLDHVHFSLTWAGALGQTSFWSSRPAAPNPGPAVPVVGLDAHRLPLQPVRMGAVGEAVETLRILLRVDPPLRPGAPRTTPDPRRDPLHAPSLDQRTLNALRALQHSSGLPATGVADRVSFERARRRFHAVPPPAPAPTSSPRPSPSTPTAARPVLRQGDRGPFVAELQDLLGMSPPPASRGIFGANTHARVVAAQRAGGLAADGVVGPRTWELLLRS